MFKTQSHLSFITSVTQKLFDSDSDARKERERSRIKAGQMDNLKAMVRIRRTDRMRHKRIRELVSVYKGVDKVINESTMRWIENM